jgi:hypothetical protein
MNPDELVKVLKALARLAPEGTEVKTNVTKVGISTVGGTFTIEFETDRPTVTRREERRDAKVQRRPVPTGEGPPPELVPGGIRGMAGEDPGKG